MKKWYIYTQERFPIFRHFILIIFLFLSNAFVCLGSLEKMPIKNALICLCISFLIFFRLRLFDEIKDYPSDCIIHQNRPLARGLILISSAKKVSFSILATEIILSLMIGVSTFWAVLLVSFYSILMYNEFFIGSWLRPRLATYALTHTPISSLITLFIFSSLTNKNFWSMPLSVFLFSIANWMIFNLFEFGRKTFGKEEEQKSIESYSRNFGSYGASIIVNLMAFIAIAIIWALSILLDWPPILFILETLLFFLLVGVSLFYAYFNSQKWGMRFRSMCSAFILLYNAILSIGFFL